ncbi:MAG: glycogen debranching enzyme family protein [Akkermansiaceae bacterium]|nr:glycogen debranching enzyme family protein [Verrucomicrobiales bacterium]
MEKLIRRIDLRRVRVEEARQLLNHEWLVTNGLGGYASGTISGVVTWRYHGLLIAALPAPLGRMVMLNHLAEHLVLADGRRVQIGGAESAESAGIDLQAGYITEFRLENQMPIWRYEVEDVVIEKTLVLLQGQNTVHVSYHLLSEQPGLRLELHPAMHFRGHEYSVSEGPGRDYVLSAENDRYEIFAGDTLPRLRLMVRNGDTRFIYDGGRKREIFYQKDADRGYETKGRLWSPGFFSVELHPNQSATLMASTEPWHTMLALNPAEALDFYQQRRARLIRTADPRAQVTPAADLVLAADQFIINPVGRLQDSARAHAAGDEIRTVIAGYHWFTDWGRDTMISLEGLTLTTGRHAEAGWILRTFAHYIREGLIPNMFPEGGNQGLYHTADATLWFFHALDRYLEFTHDRDTLRHILPRLVDVAEHHLRGTRFGIGVDPEDGLLCQGAEGYQLTWMDAKVDGWVVTPRRGKAVEINGLWYNALCLLENWLREEKLESAADQFGKHARLAKESFNHLFWNPETNSLFDVIDGEQGNSAACRPNQLLAISLKHPVLDEPRWKPVLETVRARLLTPIGLRSLSRDHTDYKPKYFGDLRARDAAYHQGTVWAWLIGPFIDAWLKVYPDDRAGARKLLLGFAPHLDAGCVGSINEIFDAEPPFVPRGCIAQAWSVAEVLRCWVKTAE